MTLIISTPTAIYSDSRGVYGTQAISVVKVFDCGNFVVGGAGCGESLMKAVHWIKTGMKVKEFPLDEETDELELVAYDRKTGKKLFYTAMSPHPIEVLDQNFCVGSGASYAIGLLSTGLSPEDTIKKVAELCPSVDANVQCIQYLKPAVKKSSKKKAE